MKTRILFLSVSLTFFLIIPASAQTTNPAAELLQSQSAMPRYGVEKYRLVNEPNEIVSVLTNGITVIAKRVASPAVAVRGTVGTGGVYEGKWLGGGLSHLLEHLVAGGSNDRRTEAENKNLLQQIGNNSNAYTTEDQTSFFINTTPPHMEQAVDLVTGWLLGAKITVPEYRREYQVVQRELEMGKGQPDREFYYMCAMNRYRISPARVPVIGYQEVIQGLSRDDVYSYYKLAYEPANMIFTVVGDLDPQAMLAAVTKNVADAKPERAFSHNIAQEPPVTSPRTMVATFPKLGQAYLQLAFPSVKLDDPDLYALDLLAAVLGGGESSILVQELRDNQHLVSSASASDDTPTYATGTFAVDLQLDSDKIAAATKLTLDLIDNAKTQIDPDRIARAKTQLKVAHVKSLQTVEELASALADDYLNTGDIHFTDRYLQRIDAITADQLRDAARRYLENSRLLTTVLLPSEDVGAAGLAAASDLIRPAVIPTTQATTQPTDSGIQRSILGNGTILLTKRITTSPMVVINMFSLGGVTAEDDQTNGLGNLTMQMLPRGTTTRTAGQIAEFLDSTGAELTCTSGNNTWSWQANCLTADFEKTLQIYSDIVNHPTFADAELDGMKQRISAAIDSQDAAWDNQAIRFFKQQYFGPSHSPYRLPAIGTKESLAKFTAEDARKWYQQKVLPSRRVLTIFGDVDSQQAKTLASKYLGTGPKADDSSLKPATFPNPAAASDPPSVDVLDVKLSKTQQALAAIVIGYQSDSIVGDPANYTLDVDQTLAGGWGYPTGYLFETLRGKGLVYVVEDLNNPGRSSTLPGTFFAFAGCEPANVNPVVDQMLLNIARLQGTNTDIQEDWFTRSKQLIATSDALDNQTPAQQAETAGLDELFGLGFDYHQQFADRINAVTIDQVRQMAAARLRKCLITICTPDPDSVKIQKGPRTYSSFPPVDLTPRGVQHDVSAKP